MIASLPALALAASLAAGPGGSAPEPAARDPRVEQAASAVDAARVHAVVARLVGFGTRHTLSGAASDARGIGAARRWLAGEFQALAREKGSRLRPFEDRFTAEPGPRVPSPVEIWNVGAILPGTDAARAKEAIVVTGHYDSRASDVMDATTDAPGAVDDGSGVAVLLELARVLADARPAVSIYLVAVAGEEQSLLGSTHLAERLRAEGVDVLATTSLDTVGNTEGQDGVKDNRSVRLFSEGVRSGETDAERRLREALGSENDGAAREWARYVKRVSEGYVENLDAWVMLRRDRIARGSDHMSFARLGVPAIRVTEAHEHYDRQHQDPRRVGGRAYGDDLEHFDAAYAAKIARGVLAAVLHLASAPAPVRDVTLGGAVSPDAKLRWTLPGDPRVAGVVLYRRRADVVAWQRSTIHPRSDSLVLKDVPPDNEVFAVATVDVDGHESLPVFPSRLE
jgi:hypothetical protein